MLRLKHTVARHQSIDPTVAHVIAAAVQSIWIAFAIAILFGCNARSTGSVDVTDGDPWFIRTDSDNDAGWDSVKSDVRKPYSDLGVTTTAHVRFVDDEKFRGLTVDAVLDALPADFDHWFLFIADQKTCSDAERPIIVVDLMEKRGRQFRAIPRMITDIESNLSIANCDFSDYCTELGDDGVHRGYQLGATGD